MLTEEVVIDEDIMEELREVAVEKGKSLEETINRYLYFVSEGHKKLTLDMSPDLASLKGKYRVPADFDQKEVLAEELYKKYR